MSGHRRVGLIVPSSNTRMEPLVQDVLADDPVDVHATRVRVTRIDLDAGATQQFDRAAMLAAARLLADAGVELLCWGGTAGSWLGPGGDRELCRDLEAHTGIPATTSTLALLDALAGLGATRIGLAVPYVAPVAAAIARRYRSESIECTASACLGITDNAAFGRVPDDVVDDLVRAAAAPPAEAVAVVCTNLAATGRATGLEVELGIPVVDSIAATAWQVRRLLGLHGPVDGWGSLLATALHDLPNHPSDERQP